MQKNLSLLNRATSDKIDILLEGALANVGVGGLKGLAAGGLIGAALGGDNTYTDMPELDHNSDILATREGAKTGAMIGTPLGMLLAKIKEDKKLREIRN